MWPRFSACIPCTSNPSHGCPSARMSSARSSGSFRFGPMWRASRRREAGGDATWPSSALPSSASRSGSCASPCSSPCPAFSSCSISGLSAVGRAPHGRRAGRSLPRSCRTSSWSPRRAPPRWPRRRGEAPSHRSWTFLSECGWPMRLSRTAGIWGNASGPPDLPPSTPFSRRHPRSGRPWLPRFSWPPSPPLRRRFSRHGPTSS